MQKNCNPSTFLAFLLNIYKLFYLKHTNTKHSFSENMTNSKRNKISQTKSHNSKNGSKPTKVNEHINQNIHQNQRIVVK